MAKPILLVDDPQSSLSELAQVLAANGYLAMVIGRAHV